jgi:hypothetical protein
MRSPSTAGAALAPIIIAACRPKDGVRQSRESVLIIFSIHHNHPVQLPLSRATRLCAQLATTVSRMWLPN